MLHHLITEVPTGARAEVILDEDYSWKVEYVKMIAGGDGYFGTARADILGGEGSGATAVPVTQSISGLSLVALVDHILLHLHYSSKVVVDKVPKVLPILTPLVSSPALMLLILVDSIKNLLSF